MLSSYASVAVALFVGLLAAAAFVLAQKKKPRPLVASAAGPAEAPVKFTEEEHARRRAAGLALLEEKGRKAAAEARLKAEAAAARAAEEKRAAAERTAAEKAAKEKAAAEKAAAEAAQLEAQRRKLFVAPAQPPASASQAAPRAAPELPNVKLQSPGGAVPASAVASPQLGATVSAGGAVTAPAAPLERTSVGVRVQFVQGRSPLQLTLPLPLPTVGELKRQVHEASGDLLPERQRLVFAGQILTPDEKDLALFKNFGEGACVICQEIAAPST